MPILTGAIELVRNSFPQRELRANIDVAKDDVSVLADEFLIDAIFNLLHNAMKHSTDNEVAIEIKVTEEQNSVKIEIDDRGPGIDNESKKALLNRLESGIKLGSGMGLTLIKRIVERYNGKIEIEDRVPGEYSHGVIVYIPKNSKNAKSKTNHLI